MTYLIIGVALFCGIHLFPAAAGLRQSLIARIGENPLVLAAESFLCYFSYTPTIISGIRYV